MLYKAKKNYFSAQDQLLFNTDDLIKRPSPDEAEFSSLVLPYIGAIETAVYSAESELQKRHQDLPPYYSNPTLDAHMFNAYVLGKLQDLIGAEQFGETPEGRTYWKLGNYIVYFKKMNQSFEPSNIPTNNTMRISAQYATATEEPKTVIFIGYRGYGNDLSNIEGVYARYLDTERSQGWIIDLAILHRTASYQTTIFDETEAPVNNTEPRVKIKRVYEEAL